MQITNLKPPFLAAPVITMDVPSSSAAPRSTRFGTAPPPPATSSSSSSSIMRVLKIMSTWCRDTNQLQDVLLSNQCHQNEKMGIDEFDKFPLPAPPLDEDPFASLSATDLAAMEAAPVDDDDKGSKYEDDGEDDNNLPPLWHHLPSFPFLVS
jgi:hypothetical protein